LSFHGVQPYLVDEVIKYLQLASKRPQHLEDPSAHKASSLQETGYAPKLENLLEVLDLAVYLDLTELADICTKMTVEHFHGMYVNC
jgi:hypothetical protein